MQQHCGNVFSYDEVRICNRKSYVQCPLPPQTQTFDTVNLQLLSTQRSVPTYSISSPVGVKYLHVSDFAVMYLTLQHTPNHATNWVFWDGVYLAVP
jgi:hypothetical protein